MMLIVLVSKNCAEDYDLEYIKVLSTFGYEVQWNIR